MKRKRFSVEQIVAVLKRAQARLPVADLGKRQMVKHLWERYRVGERRACRVLPRREGWMLGKNLRYRLYRKEGLSHRYRPERKRRSQAVPINAGASRLFRLRIRVDARGSATPLLLCHLETPLRRAARGRRNFEPRVTDRRGAKRG